LHDSNDDPDKAQDVHLPLVVVDGKEFSWNDLVRMLMSAEGWQFRLDIADPSDEL
jgi:hypothetical protein